MPARKWLAAGALLAAALSGCAIGPALRVSEAAPGTPRLLQQVAELAHAFHWSEREILDLPRDRRRRYSALLREAA